ncbi:MAG: hypothetical protein ACREP6_04320, partial [Candidatus Binataceae bacterium]
RYLASKRGTFLKAGVISGAFCLALACVVTAAQAAPIDPHLQAVAALEQMARARFGNLTAGERCVIDSAPYRNLKWCGPSKDPRDPSNDPANAAEWGASRTVRAKLLEWLMTSPAAVQYVHPSGIGIGGIRVTGPLDLSFLAIPKMVTMINCAVPDGINLSNAVTHGLDFTRDQIGQIEASQAHILGDLLLTYGHYGTLDLFRAKIDGDLNLNGSSFMGGGEMVSVIDANIGGDALFHQQFATDGIVDFRLSTINGSLSFNHARFSGTGRNGLDAGRATIEGILYWVDVAVNHATILGLRHARAATLWDDPNSWPSQNHLLINGFVYGSFGDSSADAAGRLRWLGLEPPGYHAQPFNQLAEVLTTAGRHSEAVQVQIAKRDMRRHFGGLTVAQRAWQLLLKLTIGYGYEPLRALWWIIGFVIAGTVLFALGFRWGLILPTNESAFKSFVDTGEAPAFYPPFNSLVYSLENVVPFVDLFQGIHWRPSSHCASARRRKIFRHSYDPRQVEGAVLRFYLCLHILAGWILWPLFVAGMSGLIHL